MSRRKGVGLGGYAGCVVLRGSMKRFLALVALVGSAGLVWGQGAAVAGQQAPAVGSQAAGVSSNVVLERVLREWPAGKIDTTKNPGGWSYEEGVLLDGVTAQWRVTGD